MKKIVFTFLLFASFSFGALGEDHVRIPESVLRGIVENLVTEFLNENVSALDDSPLFSPFYSAYIAESCERRQKVLAVQYNRQKSLKKYVAPYYLGAVLAVTVSLYVKLELAVVVGLVSGFLVSDKNKQNEKVEKNKKDIECKFNKLKKLKEKTKGIS